MNAPPLQVGSYHFALVNIAAQQDAKPEDLNRVEADVTTNIVQRGPENPRMWLVFLDVEIKPKKDASPGYVGKVQAVGSFNVVEGWPKEDIEKLVFINGGGILYSAIREMVCSITARGVWDMLIIPSFSFIELFKQRQQLQKESQVPVAEAKASA